MKVTEETLKLLLDKIADLTVKLDMLNARVTELESRK